MSRQVIEQVIRENFGCGPLKASDVGRDILAALLEEIHREKRVILRLFGTFKIKTLQPRDFPSLDGTMRSRGRVRTMIFYASGYSKRYLLRREAEDLAKAAKSKTPATKKVKAKATAAGVDDATDAQPKAIAAATPKTKKTKAPSVATIAAKETASTKRTAKTQPAGAPSSKPAAAKAKPRPPKK